MKSLRLYDGLRIAYQEWGAQNASKVLAVHGWLDNSNTFRFLGPYLADRGFHVVAMDVLGHGHSDHLGTGAHYTIQKQAAVAREVVDVMGWAKSSFIGHSMGSSIGVMYTAAFNDLVNKLVLIDGFGPLVQASDTVAHSLRLAVDTELKFKKNSRPPKPYKTLKEAVEQRMKAVSDYPGQQFLSREAAHLIVARAVRLANAEDTFEDIVDDNAGPVQFRHDVRCRLPSYSYSSNEQGLAYFDSIHTKTLLVRGEFGFPPAVTMDFEKRVQILQDKGLFEERILPGSHHLHLDPETRGEVAQIIHGFLQQP